MEHFKTCISSLRNSHTQTDNEIFSNIDDGKIANLIAFFFVHSPFVVNDDVDGELERENEMAMSQLGKEHFMVIHINFDNRLFVGCVPLFVWPK